MKRIALFVFCWTLVICGLAFALTNTDPQVISSYGTEPSSAAFKQLTADYVGDWKQLGQPLTNWQLELFHNIFLGVILAIPVMFLLHYLLFGAKEFSHDGPKVYIFNAFIRFIHWTTAIAFSLLVLTGLLVIFSQVFNGGQIIRFARAVHLIAAIIAAIAVIPMFLNWVKDMLPAPHDISWFLIMGGYLSKQKKPVPAGKFNAGQKTWFWLATAGTLIMAYSGYFLYSFQAPTDQLRIMVLIHNILGIALVTFFITHLYMALFAIKGSLDSMISGYKPKEELEILHSRYTIPE